MWQQFHFARLSANALLEVPTGLTEAAKSMGATHWQVVSKYYFAESPPILINAVTLTFGVFDWLFCNGRVVGGGGLGSLAINYGEHRNMVYVKWISTIIIVAIVMIFQKPAMSWQPKLTTDSHAESIDKN